MLEEIVNLRELQSVSTRDRLDRLSATSALLGKAYHTVTEEAPSSGGRLTMPSPGISPNQSFMVGFRIFCSHPRRPLMPLAHKT
jgi:hypothetical protein